MNKSVSHGIEPEMPRDGVETVPVRKDALTLYSYYSGLEKRRRRRSTPDHLKEAMPICFKFDT